MKARCVDVSLKGKVSRTSSGRRGDDRRQRNTGTDKR